MIRPLKLMLRAGLITLVVGVFAAATTIAQYVASPRALDSMSGLVVFREGYQWTDAPRFELVQYPPFEWGVEPTIIIAGLFVVVAVVAVAALLWTPGTASKPRKHQPWG